MTGAICNTGMALVKSPKSPFLVMGINTDDKKKIAVFVSALKAIKYCTVRLELRAGFGTIHSIGIEPAGVWRIRTVRTITPSYNYGLHFPNVFRQP